MDTGGLLQQTTTPTGTPTGTTAGPLGPLPGGRPAWLPSWLPDWSIQIALAVALVVVGYYLSGVVTDLISRRVSRRFGRPSVARTVLRTIQGAVVGLAAFAALNVLGLELGDLALSLSVFSAVLGFVLAPIIGSVIQGVFVLTERAFEIGDMVEFKDTGTAGFVEDITLRYTKIFTMDNTFLVVPNGTMRERDIINYSADDPRTRQSLELLVTYESDVGEARTVMEESARKVDTVIDGGPDIRIGAARYPAGPTCYIDEYGDHGVLLTLRYWLKEPYKLLAMRSAIQENVWAALEDADVEIAYPHQHMVFDETSGEMQVSMRDAGGPADDASGRATRAPDEDPGGEDE